MLSTPQLSLEAAAAFAREQGIAAHILSDEIEGESRVIGGMHAALARAVARRGEPFAKPCVILSGGETTVTVDAGKPAGNGAAGRPSSCSAARWPCNASRASMHWRRTPTASTGVGPHAGALLTPTSLPRARALGLNPQALLDAHDSASASSRRWVTCSCPARASPT